MACQSLLQSCVSHRQPTVQDSTPRCGIKRTMRIHNLSKHFGIVAQPQVVSWKGPAIPAIQMQHSEHTPAPNYTEISALANTLIKMVEEFSIEGARYYAAATAKASETQFSPELHSRACQFVKVFENLKQCKAELALLVEEFQTEGMIESNCDAQYQKEQLNSIFCIMYEMTLQMRTFKQSLLLDITN